MNLTMRQRSLDRTEDRNAITRSLPGAPGGGRAPSQNTKGVSCLSMVVPSAFRFPFCPFAGFVTLTLHSLCYASRFPLRRCSQRTVSKEAFSVSRAALIGSSGMWCLRMWCLIIIGFTKRHNVINLNIWRQNCDHQTPHP